MADSFDLTPDDGITPVDQAITKPDYGGMSGDVSTPKCSKMARDIDAAQGDLAAAARRLASGDTPNNEYPTTNKGQ